MYQTKITQKDAGQRFDKYLRRILPNAGSSFIYKMLRKKNIVLNDKKADGNEKLCEGDRIAIYFSDETLAKFMGKESKRAADHRNQEFRTAYHKISGVHILYENAHVLLADKPAGVLSQKAEQGDLSLNEWLIGYLLESGCMTEGELAMYKPSVCNRLDRNTSGIVLCAKSLRGAQMLGELLKTRTLHKYYQSYVKGLIKEEHQIEGYLQKDETCNRVFVVPLPKQHIESASFERAVVDAHTNAGNMQLEQTQKQIREMPHSYIKTAYKPIRPDGDKTLLEVELITGKPHQIRAHLASIGHPLLGDYKYGDQAWNDAYRKKCGVRWQLLHAYKVVFPQLEEPFADLSGRTFQAKLPDIFKTVSEE